MGSSRGRILFITYHLPFEDQPGAFRPWVEARLLDEAGYDVTVVTSGVHYMTGEDTRSGGGWYDRFTRAGIEIIRTWAPKTYRGSNLKRIANYLSFAVLAGVASLRHGREADVIFAGTDPVFVPPLVWLLSGIQRVPYVLDERDLLPETAVALGIIDEGWVTGVLRSVLNHIRRGARSIVAATPGIARSLPEFGVEPSRIVTLLNADPYLEPESGEAGHDERLSELVGREFVVLYAGGLGMVNDVQTMLRAAARLREERNIGFAVVGDGERRQEYEEYAEARELHNVRFLGPRSRRRTRLLIRQADVCVQPLPANSYFSNTLTSKTFDYLGQARPVVFAGRGVTRELLQESGAGISVPPEDDGALATAIRKLEADRGLWREMSRSAEEWYRQNIRVRDARSILASAIEGDPPSAE